MTLPKRITMFEYKISKEPESEVKVSVTVGDDKLYLSYGGFDSEGLKSLAAEFEQIARELNRLSEFESVKNI